MDQGRRLHRGTPGHRGGHQRYGSWSRACLAALPAIREHGARPVDDRAYQSHTGGDQGLHAAAADGVHAHSVPNECACPFLIGMSCNVSSPPQPDSYSYTAA